MNRRTRLVVLMKADAAWMIKRIIVLELIVVAIAVTLALIDAAF